MSGCAPAPTSLNKGPLPRPTTFSEFAESKMWELLNDSANQVGSKYAGSKAGKKETDCISYVREVLEYAFTATGDPGGAAGVRTNYEKGADLARYLVSKSWDAYYWNPNVAHPKDGQSEHPFSYKTCKQSNAYYTIPVKGMVVDYKTEQGFFERLFGSKEIEALEALGRVRFGFGLARGGMHTFLFSFGEVFEAHWDKIGADIYTHTRLEDWGWLSGAILVPPDAHFTLPT